MTAREVVAHALASYWGDDPDYCGGEADAVLAALREHWTSNEARIRVIEQGMAGSSATVIEWWAAIIAALFEDNANQARA